MSISMKTCKFCRYFQPSQTTTNAGQESPKLRVTSRTFRLSKCAITGEAVRPSDPECTHYRERVY